MTDRSLRIGVIGAWAAPSGDPVGVVTFRPLACAMVNSQGLPGQIAGDMAVAL